MQCRMSLSRQYSHLAPRPLYYSWPVLGIVLYIFKIHICILYFVFEIGPTCWCICILFSRKSTKHILMSDIFRQWVSTSSAVTLESKWTVRRIFLEAVAFTSEHSCLNLLNITCDSVWGHGVWKKNYLPVRHFVFCKVFLKNTKYINVFLYFVFQIHL